MDTMDTWVDFARKHLDDLIVSEESRAVMASLSVFNEADGVHDPDLVDVAIANLTFSVSRLRAAYPMWKTARNWMERVSATHRQGKWEMGLSKVNPRHRSNDDGNN